MKPFLGAEAVINVGVETVVESNTPDGKRGVVFEDDGDTGYFYARDYDRAELYFVDALHIYDADKIIDAKQPSELRIIWSSDFMVAALLINMRPHIIFHFGERIGYAQNPFPDADPKSGWIHNPLHSGLQKLFHSSN